MEVEKLDARAPLGTGLPEKFAKEGLTFDDVLLVPAESAVLPNDVSTATRLTRTIALEIPIVSAAMDTVTEARMAIALAREGGIGIVHRNLSIADQVGRGRQGEALRVRDDRRAADAAARRARRRRARADGALPRLRRADHRRRRPPRRDPHEPRPALREGHCAAGLGADDLARTSSPRRSGRRSPRPRGCCTATASRSSRSSTTTACSRA